MSTCSAADARHLQCGRRSREARTGVLLAMNPQKRAEWMGHSAVLGTVMLSWRPLPRCVQEPENLNLIFPQSVDEEVMAVGEELSCPWNPSGAPEMRGIGQKRSFVLKD